MIKMDNELDDFRKINKDADLDEVDDSSFDTDLLYGRKHDLIKKYFIKANNDDDKYEFAIRTDDILNDDGSLKKEGFFKHERSLIYKYTSKHNGDIYFDTLLKKNVHRNNSSIVLILAEWKKRRSIITTSGWKSVNKSCCRFRWAKIPLKAGKPGHEVETGVISKYILYQTRINPTSWGDVKYLLISTGNEIKVNPTRKHKLIIKLNKSGVTRKELSKHFGLSVRQIQKITEDIPQLKYNDQTEDCTIPLSDDKHIQKKKTIIERIIILEKIVKKLQKIY